MTLPAHTPTAITVHEQSRVLEVTFNDNASYRIPFELMRVYSPSAEVQGHGPGQEVLQVGKRGVTIVSIEPVGNYGIKPIYSDGHETGIYTWELLYELGAEQDVLWKRYLNRMSEAGASRDVLAPVAVSGAPAAGGCSHHHH